MVKNIKQPQGKIPAGQAVAFINLIPILCLILAVVILRERFNFYQYMASALIVLGVYLTQVRKKFQPEY